MGGTPLTQHAQARLRQRGIPPDMLELLLDYGDSVHDHAGAEVLYFTRTARESVRRVRGNGAYKRVASSLNVYAVIANGQVITVGHRTHRVNRP